MTVSKAMSALTTPSSANQNVKPDTHQSKDLELNISGKTVQEEEGQKGSTVVVVESPENASLNRLRSECMWPNSLERVGALDEGHPSVGSSACDEHSLNPSAASKLVSDTWTGSKEENASCPDSEPTGGDPVEARENMGILIEDGQCTSDFVEGIGTLPSDCVANSSEACLVRNSSSSSTESGTICFYRCCSKCLSSLHGLMQKLLVQEWGSKRNQRTVEDIHNAVASLSVDLFSSLRKRCFADYSSTLCSETSTEPFEAEGCNCRSSASNLKDLVECTCHSISGHGAADGCSSGEGHSGLNAEFILRNGVLEPGTADKDPDFHCKFEVLCLCSLAGLGVFTKVQNSHTK